MILWKVLIISLSLQIASLNPQSSIFFMDDCPEDGVFYNIATSAIIYSHRGFLIQKEYDLSFKCILRFQPSLPKWRFSVKILDFDLPEEPYLTDSCSDHLIFSNYSLKTYNTKIAVFDDFNNLASGEGSYVCNLHKKKRTSRYLEYFSDPDSQFYVGFETGSVARGRGFKLLLTAFTSASRSEECAASRDHKKSNLFACSNSNDAVCILSNLVCDGMHNCPVADGSRDESRSSSCTTGDGPTSIVDKLLALGVAASLLISLGSVIVIIACLVASICLCRRFFCRESKRPCTGGSMGGASYAIAPGGAYCGNSRTGSAACGPGGGSFINASQRSNLYSGSAPIGPYGNMNTNSSSKIPPQDFRTMSPSRYSENVGSIGGSSLGQNYWAQQQNQNQPGMRVQYMAAPRHFGASPNPMQTVFPPIVDSEVNTRPSQVSSSGFGSSQMQVQAQQFYTDVGYQPQGRPSSPSSKSARSNAASSYVNAGSGIQQPLIKNQNNGVYDQPDVPPEVTL